MQIKTADGGTSNVASQGLGVWGAVGGGLGTLALLNLLMLKHISKWLWMS